MRSLTEYKSACDRYATTVVLSLMATMLLSIGVTGVLWLVLNPFQDQVAGFLAERFGKPLGGVVGPLALLLPGGILTALVLIVKVRKARSQPDLLCPECGGELASSASQFKVKQTLCCPHCGQQVLEGNDSGPETVRYEKALARMEPYRIKRSELIMTALCSIEFFCFGVFSVYSAYFNIDDSFDNPLFSAIFFGTFWFGMTLVGLWGMLYAARHRLFLARDHLIARGIFWSKRLQVVSVTQVEWRCHPTPLSAVLRTPDQRLKIRFFDYPIEDREELISFVYYSFEQARQVGWSNFSEAQTESHPPVQSPLAAAICALLFFSMGAAIAWCWMLGWGEQWLWFGIVCGFPGVWYLWRLWAYWKNKPQEVAE